MKLRTALTIFTLEGFRKPKGYDADTSSARAAKIIDYHLNELERERVREAWNKGALEFRRVVDEIRLRLHNQGYL